MAPTRFSSGPSLWSFSFPLRVGYRACLYGRVSYPISMPACPAFNSERRRESEKPTGNQREKIDGKERGSLQSAGIGAGGEKAVGKLPRHVAKTWWNAPAMAADLTVVEDHRQCVGKDTDHGQHDESTVLMGGGLLQVTIRGDGLKGLGVDHPATASELVDE